MPVAMQSRFHGIGEYPLPPKTGNVLIQTIKVGQATPKNDGIRINDIDYTGQCSRQTPLIAGKNGLGQRVTGGGHFIDCRHRHRFSTHVNEFGGNSGAGEIRFNATTTAAVTDSRGRVFLFQTGQGVVPPFASNPVRSSEHVAIDDKTTTDTGTEYHAKHNGSPGGSAIGCLRQNKTIGIIRESDFPLQGLLQIPPQRLTDQAG